MGVAVSLLCIDGLLTILYLLGINVDVDCRIMILIMIFVIASKLMFIPMCVDRFIYTAVHFSTNGS